jgi:hypothetical protein
VHCLALHDEVFGHRVIVVAPQGCGIIANVATPTVSSYLEVARFELLYSHQPNPSQNPHKRKQLPKLNQRQHL